MPGARLHQHDLRPDAADRLAAAAGLAAGARVLEPGAGDGNLTEALLAVGATVHAIELDPERAATLRERFAEPLRERRLSVTVGDARHHLPLIAEPWQVVANPPFVHSADLVRRVLLEPMPMAPPRAVTLLLQAEAARKWCGGRRGHNRSSVLAHLAGVPRVVAELPRQAVDPPSHVDLAIWHLDRRADAPEPLELARIDRLLERAFAGPRRVRDALRGLATPAICKRQAHEHGWDPDDHPRYVSPPAWRALAAFLHSIGKLG